MTTQTIDNATVRPPLHQLCGAISAMVMLSVTAPFFVVLGWLRPDWCWVIGKFYEEVIQSVTLRLPTQQTGSSSQP